MTKYGFRLIYKEVIGNTSGCGAFWRKHKQTIQEMPTTGYLKDFIAEENMIKDQTACTNSISTYSCLSNCPTTATTPCVEIPFGYFPNEVYQKQQGNNPMAYDTKTTCASTSVSIQTPASDESKKSDFLLKEFRDISSWDAIAKLRKQFNLDAPKFPKSSQDLLDAFSKGAFKVDQAKVDKNTKYLADTDEDVIDPYEDGEYIGEHFYGITFTDLPLEDRKGYDEATSAYEKAKTDTRRAIVIGSPADGLAALKAFETWTYTPAAAA